MAEEKKVPGKATAKEINKLDDDIGENLNLWQRLTRKGNELTILIILLALLLILGIAYFSNQSGTGGSNNDPGNVDPNSPAAGASAFDFTSTNFIPKFSDLRDVVFYQGHTWVASNGGLIKYDDLGAEFFGAEDGLSGETMTSLEVAFDTLWVAYQGGVARYKDEKFVTYLDGPGGISNPKLYYDETSETLMLSTFEDFYTFNLGEDAWEVSNDNNAPIDSRYFASDNSGVYAVNQPNSSDGGQVVKYSRSSKTWRDVTPNQINDISTQLFNVGDKVVAMGEAFDNIGRRVTYVYRDGSIWRTISEYDDIATGASYMEGPRVFDTRHVRVEIGDGKFEVFSLSYDEVFKFSSEGETDNSGIQDETLFEPIRSKITEVSGLRPEYRILGVDKNSELIATYSDDAFSPYSDGVLYLRQGFENELEILEFSDTNIFVPIFCGGEFMYGFSGFFSDFDGTWENTILHQFSGRQLSEITELDGSTISPLKIEPQFICLDESIYFVSASEVWKISLTDLTVQRVVSLETANSSYLVEDTNIVFFTGEKDLVKEIEVFNASDESLEKVILPRDFDGRLGLALVDEQLWVPSPRTETIHIYDLDGEDVKSIIHDGVNGVTILDGGVSQALVSQALEDGSYQYSFVNTSDFSIEHVSNPPVAAAFFSENLPVSVYQSEESKLWVSGHSSSVFSLTPPILDI